MFLLYSILFGEGGCNDCGKCGRGERGGQCGWRPSPCREDELSSGAYPVSAECCRNRSCTGFGCRGGFSVCCDEEYYKRQYALCRCKCVCRCCDTEPCCRGTR